MSIEIAKGAGLTVAGIGLLATVIIGIGVNGHTFYALFCGSEVLVPLLGGVIGGGLSIVTVAYGALKTKKAWEEYQAIQGKVDYNNL